MTPRAAGAAWVLTVAALASGAGVAAQAPATGAASPPAAPRSTRDSLVAVPCRGQRIGDVVLVAVPPLSRIRLPEQVPSARAIEGFLDGAQREFHRASRPEAIRPFLLLRPGDACDERRRAESERLLRAQRYIASATITPVRRGDGVVLVVETRDELPILLDAQPRARDPWLRRVRVGNPNVYGQGVRLGVTWLQGDGFRNGIGAEVSTTTLLGRPLVASVAAAMDPLGHRWSAELTQPFLTDFQKAAWTLQVGRREGYFPFVRPESLALSLPVTRAYGTLGGMLRIGPPGRLFLVGTAASYEQDLPAAVGSTLREGTIRPDPLTPATGRYRETHSARLNLLLAYRQLRFMRVAGFDAVEGLQDVRVGWEVGGTIGRGLRTLGSDDSDWFTTLGASWGAGSEALYGSAEGFAEARWIPGLRVWDAILASGRATGYWRMTGNQTLVVSGEWATGRRSNTPFQLVLDDPDGAMRGFRSSREAGGSRVIARVEDRIYAGRVRNLAAVSIAPFADVGRLWAGDVPYGRATDWQASAGLALLLAVPPTSQVTWRLEVARRLTPDPWARGWQARVVIRDARQVAWRAPRDIARSRPAVLPTSLFTWP